MTWIIVNWTKPKTIIGWCCLIYFNFKLLHFRAKKSLHFFFARFCSYYTAELLSFFLYTVFAISRPDLPIDNYNSSKSFIFRFMNFDFNKIDWKYLQWMRLIINLIGCECGFNTQIVFFSLLFTFRIRVVEILDVVEPVWDNSLRVSLSN